MAIEIKKGLTSKDVIGLIQMDTDTQEDFDQSAVGILVAVKQNPTVTQVYAFTHNGYAGFMLSDRTKPIREVLGIGDPFDLDVTYSDLLVAYHQGQTSVDEHIIVLDMDNDTAEEKEEIEMENPQKEIKDDEVDPVTKGFTDGFVRGVADGFVRGSIVGSVIGFTILGAGYLIASRFSK